MIERIGVGLATAAFERLGMTFREQPVQDYGIDAHVEILGAGNATGQLIAVQLKTGASYLGEMSKGCFVFRFDSRHATYWLGHSIPVIVVLCDPDNGCLYWERITTDTVRPTGSGYKVLIPRLQKVDSDSAALLRNTATRVVPASRYTMLRAHDVSLGTAKRYSLDILLSGAATKSDVASIIRQVTEEQIKSRYYRDELVRSRWGDTDAHVVSAFVYAALDDVRHANWICRSIWVSPSLLGGDAPLRFDGENIGMGVTVDWSPNYDVLSKFRDSNLISKEAYLRGVDDIIQELKSRMFVVGSVLAKYGERGITLELLTQSLGELEPHVTGLYRRSGRMGVEPTECGDLATRFQGVVALAHNVVFPFSKEAENTWTDDVKALLASRAFRDYQGEILRFGFEREKVT